MRILKLNRFVISTCLLVIASFSIWFFYLRNERERRLIEQGNEVVKKVEIYRSKNGILPNTLSDIGIDENEGADAIYYEKRDSVNYIVTFGLSLGESMIYYSDSKEWENINREMSPK